MSDRQEGGRTRARKTVPFSNSNFYEGLSFVAVAVLPRATAWIFQLITRHQMALGSRRNALAAPPRRLLSLGAANGRLKRIGDGWKLMAPPSLPRQFGCCQACRIRNPPCIVHVAFCPAHEFMKISGRRKVSVF